MEILKIVLVTFFAGMGAGLGTGFAGMSAAAVITPMLVTFLGVEPYMAVGIALASDVLASAVSALIALSSARLFPGLQSDKIIMGAFMNLVPGVAITTFIRDLIAGDLVAGAARLLEALLIACAVAIGTGLVMSAFHLAGGLF